MKIEVFYKMGTTKYKIQGKIRKTTKSDWINVLGTKSNNLYVNVYRVGQRRKYIDEKNQVFIKVDNRWWKFPEQVEF